MQGRHESSQEYYHRLFKAYFGSKNEPGMKEDVNFKTLFIQNLHPTTSAQLGKPLHVNNPTPTWNSLPRLRKTQTISVQTGGT